VLNEQVVGQGPCPEHRGAAVRLVLHPGTAGEVEVAIGEVVTRAC
jgi:hypothetical protein